MGTIECRFCKTLLPDDSRYCFHCGNWLDNAAVNALEPEEAGAHEPLSEEDIPTSIATYNVLTDVHPSSEGQSVPDSNATILDSQSNKEETSSAVNSATVPITDEVKLVAEQDSGELLAPVQEEAVASSADGEEESQAEQEPLQPEETVAPLNAQPVDEQPTLLSAEAVPLGEAEAFVPNAASLVDDDPGNAITEPSMPAVFARVNARQMGDEEELAGYIIPASMSSTPSVSRSSGRPPLSRVITVISTMVILLAAVGGLVITGLPLVHGQTPPPVLSVSGSASPGSTLMIHGRNFAPSGSVTVLVDDVPVASAPHKMLALAEIQMAAVGQTLQQTSSTDATVVREDGSFDKAYTVPDSWQPGSSHTIRATEKGSNGGSLGAQLLVKADDLVQPSKQTPQPAVNPQVTVMPVSTVIPTVPVYPGPPIQPTKPPVKKPTPKPTPIKKPTPTRVPTPTPTPVVTPTPTPEPPTPTPIVPTPTPEPPTPTPIVPTPTPESPTPTPESPTPTPIPVVTPTPVLPTATPTSPPSIPTDTPTSIVPTVPTVPTVPVIQPTVTPIVTSTPPGRKHHHGG